MSMDHGGPGTPAPGGQLPGAPGSAGGWQPPRPAGWGQPPAPQRGAPGPDPTAISTDPLAIASFAVGIFTVVGCLCLSVFIVPFCIVGIALGLVAISNIRKKPDTLRGREMAYAGVALSALTLVLMVLMVLTPFGLLGLGLLMDAQRPR